VESISNLRREYPHGIAWYEGLKGGGNLYTSRKYHAVNRLKGSIPNEEEGSVRTVCGRVVTFTISWDPIHEYVVNPAKFPKCKVCAKHYDIVMHTLATAGETP
jgi:hypothetical protein